MQPVFLKNRESLAQILEKCQDFANFSTLREFLQAFSQKPGSSPRENSEEFEQFLQKTLIFTLKSAKTPEFSSKAAPTRHFFQVFQENVAELLENASKNCVQTFGYELQGTHFCNKGLNFSNLRVIFSSFFEEMLDFVGEAAMKALFSQYFILTKLEENCGFLQIAGPNLSDFLGLAAKKRVLPAFLAKKPQKSPFIPRNLVFFSSAMNRKEGLFRTFAIIRENLEKYCSRKTAEILKNCTISQQTRQFLFEMLEKTVKKLRKSDFNALLAENCAVEKEKYRFLKNRVKTAVSCGKTQEKEFEEIFAGLYAMNTQFLEVFRLLRRLFEKILEKNLFGDANFKEFLKKIKEFVRLKRFETFTVEEIMASMNPLKIPWLQPRSFNKKHKSALFVRNKQVFQGVLLWIFEEIAVPVLRSCFYITEKHDEGSKIFYYRKCVWNLISRLALSRFSEENVQKLSKTAAFSVINRYNIPIAKLRILPKKSTFRPLMTFFRKCATFRENLKETLDKSKENHSFSKKRLSLNEILGDVHAVLRTFKEKLGGFAVFDNEQIARKYRDFAEKWRKQGENRKKLWFLTMDIKKCYDFIDTNKLISMIKLGNLLSDNYLISKYLAIYRNKRPLSQKTGYFSGFFNAKARENAVSYEEIEDFSRYFCENARICSEQPYILVDLARHRAISKEEILEKLEIVLKYNIIQYNRSYFSQKRGIPQGLNISSVLCSYYFSTLEEKACKFVEFSQKSSLSLAMRLTDDYLLITDSKTVAEGFLEEMLRNSAENAFFFNESKITTNFLHKSSQSFQENTCKWIGKLIDMQTLEIKPLINWDFERLFNGINANIIRNNLRISLKNKLKSLLMNHFEFYFDKTLNSIEKNSQILREVSRASCIKFFAYVQRFVQLYAKNAKKNWFLAGIFWESAKEFAVYCCFLQENNEKTAFFQYFGLILSEFLDFFSKNRANFNKIYQELRVSAKKLAKTHNFLEI